MKDPEIKDIMEQADFSFRRFEEQRDMVIEDIEFAYINGGQTDDGSTQSVPVNKPNYVINKVLHPLNQINGQYRQNKITGKVRGWNSNASKELAETYTGLIRNIENISGTDEIYSQSFNHIATGGYSAWRVANVFSEDPTLVEQELRIQAIRDPFSSVWGDASSQRLDSKDWDYGLVTFDVSKASFKKRYPNAAVSDVAFIPGRNTRINTSWFNDSVAKIAEYYTVDKKKTNLHLMTDGQVIEETKDTKKIFDELANIGVNIKLTRVVEKPIIRSYKVSGLEILEGPFIWPGDWIPIIEVFGYHIYMNNELHYRGKVRFAKDAQQLYNYATTAMVESAAQSLKDPIFVTKAQMKGFANMYRDFNIKKPPFMFYNPDPEAPGIPQRTGAPAVQQAIIAQLQQADSDIKSTMGDFGATLGIPESDQSGVAIRRLQEQSESGSFDLIESQARAIKFTWETLVNVLPRIYDTERQERIINSDGEEKIVFINQEVVDEQTGQKVIVNDLSKGKFDAVITVGPATKTQRQEFLALLNEARAQDPTLAQLSADLFIKYLDAPFSDELTKRLRKLMLKNRQIEPNDEEKEQLQEEQEKENNDPNLQLQVQLAQQQFQKLMLENEELAAKIDKSAIDHDKVRAEVGKIIAETITKYTDAGIPVRDQDLMIRTLQSQQMITELEANNQAAPPSVEDNSPVPQQPVIPPEQGLQ